jgi:hypothetical protein
MMEQVKASLAAATCRLQTEPPMVKPEAKR